MVTNINNTQVTDQTSIAPHMLDNKKLDSVDGGEKYTQYINERFKEDWTATHRVPKLFSATQMKSIWTVGKRGTGSVETMTRIGLIKGNGKENFWDILYSMVFTALAVRDSFANIIWNDPERKDWPRNLRLLDPSKVSIFYDEAGMIAYYEHMGPKGPTRIERDDMFHLTHNRFAGSMHGTSIPEICEKIIMADDELFQLSLRTARFKAVPFIVYKVKSDDATTIGNFKANIKQARDKGEDLIIPDDNNLVAWETVDVQPSTFLMEFRESNNLEFYRAVGMPLVLFGGSGVTESGGKIEYLGHETVFEFGQGYVEQQILQQLKLEIDLYSPTTLLENLQSDERKDAQAGLAMQQSDMSASRGR